MEGLSPPLESSAPHGARGSRLSAISLERTSDLPAVVVGVAGTRQRGIDVGALAALDVRESAVLLHTGDDARFGAPAYGCGAHFLTCAGAAWLADHEAALVGIYSVSIDDIADPERPAHTLLLAAGIPIVEHLTGLGKLPLPVPGSPRRRRASREQAASRSAPSQGSRDSTLPPHATIVPELPSAPGFRRWTRPACTWWP